jgi:NADH-ubiquinone oxidoreductase chain 2
MINLIILGLSSCFILFGSTLLYVNTGITHLDGIYILYNLIDYSLISLDIIKENTIKIQEMNLIQAFNISFIILSVGYLFKVSSAPFHFWSPVK